MKPKLEEPIQAQKLRKEGFSLKEISILLGVSKSSISVWTKYVQLGKEARLRLRNIELQGSAKGRATNLRSWAEYRFLHPKPLARQARFVESFFDIWSNDMTWVLGYFAADGTMFRNKRGSYYIAFASTDKELLIQVKNIMHVSNKIEEYKQRGWKIRFTLQVGSKKLFMKLLELGFTPNKSLTLRFPPIPDQYFSHFLRGYFDGDGCATFTTRFRKDRNKQYPQLTISLTSASIDFIQSLQQKIEYFVGTIGGSLHRTTTSKFHPCYTLVYSTQNVLKLHSFMYPTQGLPCLERKKLILERGINFGAEV